jgi:FixJ family two-component response regulator
MVAHRSQIAIVDDDPAMRRAVGRLCAAAALPSRGFSSAEEFLTSDALADAGFLILDIHLPGLSGFQLHEQLVNRGIDMPVVFITGQDQPLDREKARQAGAAAYLTKPFPAAQLITALHKHLPPPHPPTNHIPKLSIHSSPPDAKKPEVPKP